MARPNTVPHPHAAAELLPLLLLRVATCRARTSNCRLPHLKHAFDQTTDFVRPDFTIGRKSDIIIDMIVREVRFLRGRNVCKISLTTPYRIPFICMLTAS